MLLSNSFYVTGVKPKNICCFYDISSHFLIKPSHKSILTMSSVILVDVIRTVSFLSMLAFHIEVIMSIIVSCQPLRLNAFQREPASSRFERHFTSNNNSSADSSTSIGLDLHLVCFILVVDRSPRFEPLTSDNSQSFPKSLSIQKSKILINVLPFIPPKLR